MNDTQEYPIGTAGKKWGENEKAEWLAVQSIKRSYSEEVLTKLEALKVHLTSSSMALCLIRPIDTRFISSNPVLLIPKRQIY